MKIFKKVVSTLCSLAMICSFIPVGVHADETKPVIIFKLDDLGKDNVESFSKVFDIVQAKGIKASFGVIGKNIENADWETYATIRNWYANGIEIWHHGYYHNESEYSTDNYETQKEHFKKTLDIMYNNCGITLQTFGSPYNNATSDAISMINTEFPQIKTMLFVNDTEGISSSTMLNSRVNIEFTGINYDSFVSEYNANSTKQYMVLQGHPDSWGDSGLVEFTKIVDFLKGEGCTFSTPTQYSNGTLIPMEERTKPDEMTDKIVYKSENLYADESDKLKKINRTFAKCTSQDISNVAENVGFLGYTGTLFTGSQFTADGSDANDTLLKYGLFGKSATDGAINLHTNNVTLTSVGYGHVFKPKYEFKPVWSDSYSSMEGSPGQYKVISFDIAFNQNLNNIVLWGGNRYSANSFSMIDFTKEDVKLMGQSLNLSNPLADNKWYKIDLVIKQGQQNNSSITTSIEDVANPNTADLFIDGKKVNDQAVSFNAAADFSKGYYSTGINAVRFEYTAGSNANFTAKDYYIDNLSLSLYKNGTSPCVYYPISEVNLNTTLEELQNKEKNGVYTLIDPDITVNDYKNSLQNKELTVTVKDCDGNVLDANSSLGTGGNYIVLETSDGTEYYKYATAYEKKPFTGVKEFFADGFTTQPETEIFTYNASSGGGIITRNTETGEMIMTVNSYCTPDFVTPEIYDTETERIAYEVNVSVKTGEFWTVKLRVGNGASNGWTYNFKDLYVCREACRLYIVLDRITGTAYVYKEGTAEAVAVVSDYFPKGNMTQWKAVQIMFRNSINNPVKSINYDFVAGYALDDSFNFKILDSSVSGAEIMTSQPIDALLSQITVDGKNATVTKKKDTYNTYTVTFAEKLQNASHYIMKINPYAIDRTKEYITASVDFETEPAKMEAYTAPEILFFDDASQQPDTEPFIFTSSTNGTFTRDTEHSEFVIKVGSYCMPDLQTPEINDSTIPEVVFELESTQFTGTWWTPKLRVGTASTWTKNYTDLVQTSVATRIYAVYNRETGVATVYKEGSTEPISVVDSFPAGLSQYPRIEFMTRNSINSPEKNISYDYIAVYENKSDFSFEILNSSAVGNDSIIIKTTKPISVGDTKFSIDGVDADIEKVPDTILTYRLKFGEKLRFGNTYNLYSRKICDLSGKNMISEESIPFTVKTSATYSELGDFSDLTIKVNDEKTNSAFEKGIVNITSDVTSYKDNLNVTMIAAEYKNGVMNGVRLIDKKISGKDTVSLDYTADDTENTVLKAFLWENASGSITPLKSVNVIKPRTGAKIESVDTQFYPGWKRKAVTFSYDDNADYDEELIRLFNKYDVRGTFNVVAGWVDNDARKQRFKERYKNQELASHSYSHPRFTSLTADEIKKEIDDSIAYIKEITGKDVKGFVWPYTNPNNSEATQYLRDMQIEYARSSGESGNFDIPSDWMSWNTTCHHNNITQYSSDFFSMQPDTLKLFSIWGHSQELSADWSVMENFLIELSQHNDIWNATNSEIVQYVNAIKNLEITDTYIKNNSETTVYVKVNGVYTTILPGNTYRP